jgi:hypothetical protein
MTKINEGFNPLCTYCGKPLLTSRESWYYDGTKAFHLDCRRSRVSDKHDKVAHIHPFAV